MTVDVSAETSVLRYVHPLLLRGRAPGGVGDTQFILDDALKRRVRRHVPQAGSRPRTRRQSATHPASGGTGSRPGDRTPAIALLLQAYGIVSPTDGCHARPSDRPRSRYACTWALVTSRSRSDQRTTRWRLKSSSSIRTSGSLAVVIAIVVPAAATAGFGSKRVDIRTLAPSHDPWRTPSSAASSRINVPSAAWASTNRARGAGNRPSARKTDFSCSPRFRWRGSRRPPRH